MRSNPGCIVSLCTCLCLFGCAGEAVPDLVPVEGTLTLQGKPLANKSLRFVPESGNGLTGHGNTDKNGKYRLLAIVPGAVTDHAGLTPGKYRVVVFEPMAVMETPGASGSGALLIPSASGSEIPLDYQSANTTRLFAEVPAAGGKIDLDLAAVP